MQLGIRKLIPLVQKVNGFLTIPYDENPSRHIVPLQDVFREPEMLIVIFHKEYVDIMAHDR
jgi:hypothetical protein